MTVYVATLPGIQADLLLTMVSEVTSAWAYGERIKDVQCAGADVKKAAKAHALSHQF